MCSFFYFGIEIEMIYSEFPSDRLGDITWDTVMSSGQKFESIHQDFKNRVMKDLIREPCCMYCY